MQPSGPDLAEPRASRQNARHSAALLRWSLSHSSIGVVLRVIRKLFDRFARRSPAGGDVLHCAASAQVPDGVRVYAIGDIHGRADLLAQTFARIDADEARRPVDRSITVLLGDYIDRGLQSRQVIDLILERAARRYVVAVQGNHDAYMLRALTDPDAALKWLANGGRETLYSYDIVVPGDVNRDTIHAVMAQAGERIPASHKAFLETLLPSATIGDYAFVHAGLRPGVALEDQLPDELMTIRQPFLDYAQPHDFLIVHGHTPVKAPDFRMNRINIDTGAYITGNLTCLVLEANGQFVLS